MTENSKSATFTQAVHDFKRSVEITRDVRFQANLRLARRSRLSSYVISFLSTYVIALSLRPNIIHLETYQSQILLACSIVLAVFVIFTSLIDGSQNFFYHGELLHSCARKIATIHHDMKLVDATSDNEENRKALRELQARYQKALDECPVNHDNVDFYKEIATKPHLFPDQYKNYPKLLIIFLNKARALVYSNGWMLPHLAVTLAISFVVLKFILLGASFPAASHKPAAAHHVVGTQTTGRQAKRP